MAVIYVDMDGTLCNTVQHFFNYCSKKMNTKCEYKKEYAYTDSFVLLVQKYFKGSEKLGSILKNKCYNDVDFWSTIPPMPNAVENFKYLIEKGNEVYIATSTFNTKSEAVLVGKLRWIKKYLPFFDVGNISYLHFKYKLIGDYMIEDSIFEMERFLGKTIAINWPYNQEYKAYLRVNGWDDIGKHFGKK